MAALLGWIEASALGRFVRESGPWTYPLVNLTHIVGIAALFGAILVLDLTILRAWRRASDRALAPIAAAASPIAAGGFTIAALSGVALLASNGSEYIGNPFLLIKFPLIVVGFANAVAVRRSSAWRAVPMRDLSPDERRRLALMAGVSLVSWTGALAAGRMIGYW